MLVVFSARRVIYIRLLCTVRFLYLSNYLVWYAALGSIVLVILAGLDVQVECLASDLFIDGQHIS